MGYFEAGTVEISTKHDRSFGVDISNLGLSSPVLVADRAYDITDPAAITSADAILTNSSSLTTSIWTTPLIQPAAVKKNYRVECEFTDSGNTHLVVLYVNSGAF